MKIYSHVNRHKRRIGRELEGFNRMLRRIDRLQLLENVRIERHKRTVVQAAQQMVAVGRESHRGHVRNLDDVRVGLGTLSLAQLQSALHQLHFPLEVDEKNSAGIVRASNQVVVRRAHVDCGDEVVRLVKDPVELHLSDVDGENIASGLCTDLYHESD